MTTHIDMVNPSGVGAICYGEVCFGFSGCGEIVHDYFIINKNVGDVFAWVHGQPELQALCHSWLFSEVQICLIPLFCRLIIVY